MDPARAIVEIKNYKLGTSQIAQTTLRSILGQAELDDLLSRRDKINTELQIIIDEQTDPWGIKVSIVEIKDVELRRLSSGHLQNRRKLKEKEEQKLLIQKENFRLLKN